MFLAHPATSRLSTLSLHDALPISQHRVPGLERVEDGRARDRAADVELHLVANVRQGAQVRREDDANHRRVWTSTDSTDRKSTRLNSSHRTISYAVFCLKKKTTQQA